jgi:hypothetical protein
MTALHTVHVRVNDAATGKPTPCRIRLTDADGNYYPPLGRLSHFATGRGQDVGGNLLLGDKQYAYIDGACEVPLPAGTIHAELWKGPEYRPRTIEVNLPAGKLALRLEIERWTNLREQGWYAGDTRAHFLSPHGALLEAAAEDLAVVNVLAFEDRIEYRAGNTVPAIPNILDFSGQKPAAEMPGHLVAVNTHNTHPVLGSLGLLNTHRVVYPLRFGGPDGADDWTLRDWCGQCHRKGGLVLWSSAWHQARPLSMLELLGELLADLILGEIDAYELHYDCAGFFSSLSDWYDLLRCGMRVPLVAGSAKGCNGVALGAMRTYAQLPQGEPLMYRGWIEAVRAGRTFITNGPFLTLSVEGRGPGDVLAMQSDGVVSVRAEARSAVPFEWLELHHNGGPVAATRASGDPPAAVVEAKVPVHSCDCLTARCHGDHLVHHRPEQRVFAHTSPVYVTVAGQQPRPDPGVAQRLLNNLDKMIEWVAREARCPTDKHRADLAAVFTAAREELLRRMG